MPYQRVTLPNTYVGDPGPLPLELVGLADESLANLSAALDPAACDELGYTGVGFLWIEPPAPTPERRLIPKSTVIARVNTAGKLAEVWAALQSQPLLFSQWFTPDWPNVFFDDAGMLVLLDAVGCTEEQIEAITAP